MVAHTSLNSRIEMITGPLSMPEPPSFDFEEMIRAKAEFNAAMAAKIDESILQKCLKTVKSREPKADNAPTRAAACRYVYDYALVGELVALKRKKNATR